MSFHSQPMLILTKFSFLNDSLLTSQLLLYKLFSSSSSLYADTKTLFLLSILLFVSIIPLSIFDIQAYSTQAISQSYLSFLFQYNYTKLVITTMIFFPQP